MVWLRGTVFERQWFLLTVLQVVLGKDDSIWSIRVSAQLVEAGLSDSECCAHVCLVGDVLVGFQGLHGAGAPPPQLWPPMVQTALQQLQPLRKCDFGSGCWAGPWLFP